VSKSMIAIEIVPTGNSASQSDDTFTHLVCRHDVPIHGPVTDPTVRALCGRNMYGESFGITGPICAMCQHMAQERPVTCPATGRTLWLGTL
jgi:hypothetical protein